MCITLSPLLALVCSGAKFDTRGGQNEEVKINETKDMLQERLLLVYPLFVCVRVYIRSSLEGKYLLHPQGVIIEWSHRTVARACTLIDHEVAQTFV
jgi:hypothetical protein